MINSKLVRRLIVHTRSGQSCAKPTLSKKIVFRQTLQTLLSDGQPAAP